MLTTNSHTLNTAYHLILVIPYNEQSQETASLHFITWKIQASGDTGQYRLVSTVFLPDKDRTIAPTELEDSVTLITYHRQELSKAQISLTQQYVTHTGRINFQKNLAATLQLKAP